MIAGLFLVGRTNQLGQGIFQVLIVVFVRVVLHGTAQVFGWFVSAQGVGGVIGGLLIGAVGRVVPPRYLMTLGLGAAGVGILAIVNFRILPLVLIITAVVGLLIVGSVVGEQTMLQAGVADEYRGRVFGAYGMIISVVMLGGMGLGSALEQQLGLVPLLAAAGGLYLFSSLLALVLLRGPMPGTTSSHEVGQETASTAGS